MKMTVFPIIGVALGIAFSSFFTQEVASAEKAQRLCLVNSPAELIACRRGDSLYYQQPGLVHGKYLLVLLLSIATQTSRLIFSFHTFFVFTQELKRKLPHKKCVERK